MGEQDALTSVILKSCMDLVDNEDLHWSYANKTEEYMASFGLLQFGIKLVDSGLPIVESPISSFSTWMSGGIRRTRRHLRAARRAGEKENDDSCKARSLLMHMATSFPFNAVLDSMGVCLVEMDSSEVDDDIEDPEYLPSSDESENDLEFWSDLEFEEESDTGSESIESSDGEEEADAVHSSDGEFSE